MGELNVHMNCPNCNHDATSIVDTRQTEGGETVRRRRECKQCQFRYTTYERKNWNQLRVKKSDDTTELYDEQKIQHGMELAVEKRPVSAAQIAEITDQITAEMTARDEQIIESETIGAVVADRLRELDHVAFVRFVSVYRGYSDPAQFVDVLDDILADDAFAGSEAEADAGSGSGSDSDSDSHTDTSTDAETDTDSDVDHPHSSDAATHSDR